MEIVFMILLLILVVLFYISNRGNKVNKWCAFSGLFFWIGVFKEIYLFKIIPYIESIAGGAVSGDFLIKIYSLQAWAANTLSMPTATYMSIYFCGINRKNPKAVRFLRLILCASVIILSFFFHPVYFIKYQTESRMFWYIYTAYNFILCSLFSGFMIKGVLNEKQRKIRVQKLLVTLIILPPVIYCLFAVYIIYSLNIGGLFDLWKGNVFIIALCLALYIYMAFRDGVMGLRLSKETYNWNFDMELVNKGAEFTGHMIKNQTNKMEWCVKNLRLEYEKLNEQPPEELFILSRSLAAVKEYMEKIKKHSKTIFLCEETVNLKDLIESSISLPDNSVEVRVEIQSDIYILCDRTHMTEVFSNIILNACDAVKPAQNNGKISVTGKYCNNGDFYSVSFRDNGVGMDKKDIENIFKPYFTTKNTEKNFGLGLSYCKNVIDKHGGKIKAESAPGNGAAIIIDFPAKRIDARKINGGEGGENV